VAEQKARDGGTPATVESPVKLDVNARGHGRPSKMAIQARLGAVQGLRGRRAGGPPPPALWLDHLGSRPGKTNPGVRGGPLPTTR
jgi:hypothetical protein